MNEYNTTPNGVIFHRITKCGFVATPEVLHSKNVSITTFDLEVEEIKQRINLLRSLKLKLFQDN